MKISELTKFSISLTLIPIVPAWLIYKYIGLKPAIILLACLWFIALISFCSKKFAAWLKQILEKIGAFLGKYISYAALFFIFIVAVIPTKLMMMLAKRDRLKRRSFDDETYWINCSEQKHDYELEY